MVRIKTAGSRRLVITVPRQFTPPDKYGIDAKVRVGRQTVFFRENVYEKLEVRLFLLRALVEADVESVELDI